MTTNKVTDRSEDGSRAKHQVLDSIKAHKYTTSGPAGRFERTTKAVAEFVSIHYGYEMKKLVLYGQETSYTAPTLLKESSEVDKLIWSKEYDQYLKDIRQYEKDKAQVFGWIVSQCDGPMKSKLEGMPRYLVADTKRDIIELLKLIKEAAYGAHDEKYGPCQAVEALKQLMKVQQGEEESLSRHHERFTCLCERAQVSYGDVVPPKMVADSAEADQTKARDQESSRFLSYLFMQGVRPDLRPMLKTLDNEFALGDDKYPVTVPDALEVLAVYEQRNLVPTPNKKTTPQQQDDAVADLSFAQMTKSQAIK